jgi:hypothetical protein
VSGPLAQAVEDHPLAFQGPGRRRGDLVLELLEFRRDVPLGVLEGLLAGERIGRPPRLGRGQLDVVAEDRVVPDLQRRQVVLGDQPGLVIRQPHAGVLFQTPGLVEFLVDPVPHGPAVPEMARGVVDQRLLDPRADRGQGRGVRLEPPAQPRERLRLLEDLDQPPRGQHRIRQAHQVPRVRPAQRHAPRDAGDVGHVFEGFAERIGQRPAVDERLDGVVAFADRLRVPRRAAQPGSQPTLAHRRPHHAARAHRAGQEHARQRPRQLAVADGLFDLQRPKAGRIDAAGVVAVDHAGRADVGQGDPLALELAAARRVRRGPVDRLGLPQIADHRSRRPRARGRRVESEALQRCDLEQPRDRFHGFLGPEVPRRPAGARGPERGQQALDPLRRLAGHRLGEQDLLDAPPGQLVDHLAGRRVDDLEQPGRQLDYGRPDRPVVEEGHRPERDRLLVPQHRLVDQGARRDDLGDAAVDHALGVLGVLQLVHDRHAEPVLEGPLQVGRLLVVRDPGDGDAVAAVDHGQAERPAHRLGVRAEEFVEVAHPEEEDAVGELLLAAGPLLHRRRRVGVFGHRTDRIEEPGPRRTKEPGRRARALWVLVALRSGQSARASA